MGIYLKPSAVRLLPLLALTALGCSLFTATPTVAVATENPGALTPETQAVTEPPAANAGSGQVTVTGAITKAFTPSSASALLTADRVTIALHEADGVSGAVVQFAKDIQPGTYPVNDHLHNPVVDVFGEYDIFGDNHQIYLSTDGTLTLTKTGDAYSGTFTFTAENIKDASAVITVSGSFADLSLGS